MRSISKINQKLSSEEKKIYKLLEEERKLLELLSLCRAEIKLRREIEIAQPLTRAVGAS